MSIKHMLQNAFRTKLVNPFNIPRCYHHQVNTQMIMGDGVWVTVCGWRCVSIHTGVRTQFRSRKM